MNALNFETGVVTFSINGKCDVSFNPTDSAFVERLFQSFEDLDRQQEEHQAELSKMSDKKEIFEFTRSRNAEMREVIDKVFGAPICDAVFGDMNVYALAGGLPVWCNLILAVMDQVDSTFAREQKATNPRIQKYTAKYHR